MKGKGSSKGRGKDGKGRYGRTGCLRPGAAATHKKKVPGVCVCLHISAVQAAARSFCTFFTGLR
eukprot:4230352-Amphidinium_carterae.1